MRTEQGSAPANKPTLTEGAGKDSPARHCVQTITEIPLPTCSSEDSAMVLFDDDCRLGSMSGMSGLALED